MRRLWILLALASLFLLLGGTAAGAQAPLVQNGDFEGGFTPFMNPEPKDGVVPDFIPDGWLSWQSFNGGVEMSTVASGAGNGPGSPGASCLHLKRTAGGGTGDTTMVHQDLRFRATECSALYLDIDTKVISHDLAAGGLQSPAFEWPAMVSMSR